MRRASGLALAALLLLRSDPAWSQLYVSAPDQVRILWFKLGVTSERRLLLGIAFESELKMAGGTTPFLLSWTGGAEVSPGAVLAPLRLFATINGSAGGLGSGCDGYFVGVSAGPVVAIGSPTTHAGLRFGAHFASFPLIHPSGAGPALSLGYGFSWLRGAGPVHDFGAGYGPSWTADGHCNSG